MTRPARCTVDSRPSRTPSMSTSSTKAAPRAFVIAGWRPGRGHGRRAGRARRARAFEGTHVPLFVTVPQSAFHGDIPCAVRVIPGRSTLPCRLPASGGGPMIAALLSRVRDGPLGSTLASSCVAASSLLGGLTQIGRAGLRSPGLPFLRLAPSRNAGRIASYSAAGALAASARLMIACLRCTVRVCRRLAAGVLSSGPACTSPGLSRFAMIERGYRFAPRRAPARLLRTLPGGARPRRAVGGMPCGLVHGALGIALGTGAGAPARLTMAAFGMERCPLLTMGALAQRVARFTRTSIRRAAGSRSSPLASHVAGWRANRPSRRRPRAAPGMAGLTCDAWPSNADSTHAARSWRFVLPGHGSHHRRRRVPPVRCCSWRTTR